MSVPVVCSVGCSEPWNAAGTGLDIRALADLGVRAVSVIAGVTAQDRGGVHAAEATSPALIAAQFDALARARIAAFRVGALLDAASVALVAARVLAAGVPVVYDPVLAPSGGGTFSDAATRRAILESLLPVVTIVTPNLDEACVLARLSDVRTPAEMEACGRALLARGAGAVLVKGGHLAGDAIDIYVDAAGTRTYRSSRLAGDVRGTGCLLACGIAAGLAEGSAMHDAIERARAFVRERFAAAVEADGRRAAY